MTDVLHPPHPHAILPRLPVHLHSCNFLLVLKSQYLEELLWHKYGVRSTENNFFMSIFIKSLPVLEGLVDIKPIFPTLHCEPMDLS